MTTRGPAARGREDPADADFLPPPLRSWTPLPPKSALLAAGPGGFWVLARDAGAWGASLLAPGPADARARFALPPPLPIAAAFAPGGSGALSDAAFGTGTRLFVLASLGQPPRAWEPGQPRAVPGFADELPPIDLADARGGEWESGLSRASVAPPPDDSVDLRGQGRGRQKDEHFALYEVGEGLPPNLLAVLAAPPGLRLAAPAAGAPGLLFHGGAGAFLYEPASGALRRADAPGFPLGRPAAFAPGGVILAARFPPGAVVVEAWAPDRAAGDASWRFAGRGFAERPAGSLFDAKAATIAVADGPPGVYVSFGAQAWRFSLSALPGGAVLLEGEGSAFNSGSATCCTFEEGTPAPEIDFGAGRLLPPGGAPPVAISAAAAGGELAYLALLPSAGEPRRAALVFRADPCAPLAEVPFAPTSKGRLYFAGKWHDAPRAECGRESTASVRDCGKPGLIPASAAEAVARGRSLGPPVYCFRQLARDNPEHEASLKTAALGGRILSGAAFVALPGGARPLAEACGRELDCAPYYDSGTAALALADAPPWLPDFSRYEPGVFAGPLPYEVTDAWGRAFAGRRGAFHRPALRALAARYLRPGAVALLVEVTADGPEVADVWRADGAKAEDELALAYCVEVEGEARCPTHAWVVALDLRARVASEFDSWENVTPLGDVAAVVIARLSRSPGWRGVAVADFRGVKPPFRGGPLQRHCVVGDRFCYVWALFAFTQRLAAPVPEAEGPRFFGELKRQIVREGRARSTVASFLVFATELARRGPGAGEVDELAQNLERAAPAAYRRYVRELESAGKLPRGWVEE